LETKVEELQKASEAANNENQLLRSKVDKMTVELNEYKKRVTATATATSTRTPMPTNSARTFGLPLNNNINDVNFQFEFPKFGVLPGPPAADSTSAKTSPPSLIKRSSTDQSRDASQSRSPSNSSSYSQVGLDSQMKDDLANMAANIFNPVAPHGSNSNDSRSSFDSHPGTSHSSPSASSSSNAGGASSSCGTSPEPFAQCPSGFTQSPTGFKPLDTMATIGEESANLHNFGQGKISLGAFMVTPCR
jgi:AP-1-like factor